jgi:type I site-specific restriction-modification system R (restriction) subunit
MNRLSHSKTIGLMKPMRVMIMMAEMKLIYDNKRDPYWIEDAVLDQVGPSFHLRVHASHTQSSFIGRADFLWMDENKEVLKLADIKLNPEAVIHFRKFKLLWIFSPIGRKDWNCQRLGLSVIVDEAHSSQSGEAAAKLKAVLSPEELKELNDGGEVSTEDILAAQMAARADDSGITFVAFTATPKNKTMELFGTRPNPSKPEGPGNLPAPFHVYSMRQAIEEGFILDVLKNYTPYKLAFKLAHDGKDYDEKTVARSEAVKRIMGWVRLHPYNIAQKVQIVVEHFREYVAPLRHGKTTRHAGRTKRFTRFQTFQQGLRIV